MFAESQFVFDLELPLDFKPRVGDGEVQDFYLLPIDKVSVLNSIPVKSFSEGWHYRTKTRWKYERSVVWWPCLGFRWRNCWPLMTSNPTLPWWSWTSSSDTHLLSQTQVCAKRPLLNSMIQSGDCFTFVDWMLFISEPCYQEFVAGLHQTLEWGWGLSPLSQGQNTTKRVLFSCLHLSVFLSDKC